VTTQSTTCSVRPFSPFLFSSPHADDAAAPSGQSCGDYAGAFAEAVGGYLGNPNAIGEQCQFCQYSVGQSFYAPLSIDFALRGRDIGIYICYIVFNSLCLLLAARFLSYTKR
jgi:hypothetical protein